MCFPNKESHRVFFLILFSLKKKIKISGDSKSFLKINFHQTNKKTSFTIEWERIEQNAGSKKWRLHWGILEGQTWTQVKGNVAFDWSINGYPSQCVLVWLVVDYTLRALICLSMIHVWLLCSFVMLTCWLHRLILLPTLA